VGILNNKGKRKKADAITEKILDEPPLDNETIFANFQVIFAQKFIDSIYLRTNLIAGCKATGNSLDGNSESEKSSKET
jgi:hypothetical protein